jgi:hypothetical protein
MSVNVLQVSVAVPEKRHNDEQNLNLNVSLDFLQE